MVHISDAGEVYPIKGILDDGAQEESGCTSLGIASPQFYVDLSVLLNGRFLITMHVGGPPKPCERFRFSMTLASIEFSLSKEARCQSVSHTEWLGRRVLETTYDVREGTQRKRAVDEFYSSLVSSVSYLCTFLTSR